MKCKVCNSEKNSKFCKTCGYDTPIAYSLVFSETIRMSDNLRNHLKSGEKIGKKPIHEVEQYVGNKDKNVISELERIRSNEQTTRVIHRLWRRLGNIFKKVHEHEK